MNAQELASTIDHTLLKPEATPDQVRQLCAEARQYAFASVCINPVYVPLAVAELRGSKVMTCTVISFPLGSAMTEVKVYEAQAAIRKGAAEVDMVIHVGALKAGQNQDVLQDIAAVVAAGHQLGAAVKVIIETCLLTDNEKVIACQLAQQAEADFVKTSTGFSSGGATLEDVALMRRTVGSQMGVKASGGIRALPEAIKMIEAGATRIGTSAGVKIVTAL
jgi:deoxyribose-phosphate aldolase